MLITALKHHASLTSYQDMHALCASHLRELNICIVNLIRVSRDGKKVSYLCDNLAWLEHYLAHDYPAIGFFEKNMADTGTAHTLWTAFNDDDPILIDSRAMFNINYGITITRTHHQYTDYFNFGTAINNPSIQQELFAQQDKLDQFINLFYVQAKHLLQKANKSAFYLSDFQKSSKTKPIRHHLGAAFDYQYLTPRELDTIQWLLQGKTVPEIAMLLAIATRTAEKHVENIKQKLQCKTQCQLGFIAAKLALDQPAPTGEIIDVCTAS